MVSGLSLGLGFSPTFVCTSSIATLVAVANNPFCFIFKFEGHSKHFVHLLSVSQLSWAGSCLFNSFCHLLSNAK